MLFPFLLWLLSLKKKAFDIMDSYNNKVKFEMVHKARAVYRINRCLMLEEACKNKELSVSEL